MFLLLPVMASALSQYSLSETVFNPYVDGVQKVDIWVSDYDDGDKYCYAEYVDIDFTITPTDMLTWMAAVFQPYQDEDWVP
jgi:hypothetical protein